MFITAVGEYQRKLESIFPQFQVGLLHGRMASAQKDERLAAGVTTRAQILVSAL